MPIQDMIIKALEASHAAHEAALARIEGLTGEQALMRSRIADLEAKLADFAAKADNFVEPDAIQSLLVALEHAVERTRQALRPLAAMPETPAPDVAPVHVVDTSGEDQAPLEFEPSHDEPHLT